MSSTSVVGLLLAAAVLAYSIVVPGRLLPGVLLAALVYLFAWVVERVSRGDLTGAFGRLRLAVTGLLVAGILVYATLVTTELLLGVLVALVVVGVSWATVPDGPVDLLLSRVGDSRT